MTKQEVQEYSLIIADLLSEKKAQNVLVIDVEKETPLFDFLIVADTDSFIHLNALANFVKDKMDELKIKKLNPTNSFDENPWVLIDCGFMVIHLFSEEARSFYSLEKLWAGGTVIYDSAKTTKQEVLV